MGLVAIMLDFKPDWVPVESADGDDRFPVYPNESITEWHAARGLEVA